MSADQYAYRQPLQASVGLYFEVVDAPSAEGLGVQLQVACHAWVAATGLATDILIYSKLQLPATKEVQKTRSGLPNQPTSHGSDNLQHSICWHYSLLRLRVLIGLTCHAHTQQGP